MEGDVGHADGSRSGQGSKSVRRLLLVVRQEVDLHDGLGVVVVGEQRTQCTVDKT